MAFSKAMQAANINMGIVYSPDFPACYLTYNNLKNAGEGFLIIGAQAGEYVFFHDDVVEFKVVATGATWIKWFMRFKDGKIAIVTSHVDDKGCPKVPITPIDGAFGDLLFKEVKRCPDCGAIVSEDMNFCGECGKRLR